MKILNLIFLSGALILNNPISSNSPTELFMRLSDAFSMAGVFSVCIGLLSYSKARGVFDMIGYGINKILVNVRGEKGEDFYSYTCMREKSDREYFSVKGGIKMIMIGFAFLLLWIIFGGI